MTDPNDHYADLQSEGYDSADAARMAFQGQRRLASEAEPDEPESEECEGFAQWVKELAKQCTCDGDRPCDGLLAGGLCDETKQEPADE